MFNITGGEVIIIAIVALVILGPDKLPDFVRRAGRVYGEVKKISQGFKTEFRDVIEEPVREMQDTVNLAKSWFDEGKAAVGPMDDVEWNTPITPDREVPEQTTAGEVPTVHEPFTAPPQSDLTHLNNLDGDADADGAADALDDVDDDEIDDGDGDDDDDPNFYDEAGNMITSLPTEPRMDSFGQVTQRPDSGNDPA